MHFFQEDTRMLSLPGEQPGHDVVLPLYFLPLEVYYQLIPEEILDDTSGELRGRPLGTITDHLPRCKYLRGSRHSHVLWIKHESVLRIDTIPLDWEDYGFCWKRIRQKRRHIFQMNDLLALLLLPTTATSLPLWNPSEGRYSIEMGGYHLTMARRVYVFWKQIQESKSRTSPFGDRLPSAPDQSLYQEIGRAARNQWKLVRSKFSSLPNPETSEGEDVLPSPAQIWNHLCDETQALADYQQNRQTTLFHLYHLNQIFIRAESPQERADKGEDE